MSQNIYIQKELYNRHYSKYTVYLDETIGGVHKYREFLHILKTASEFDVVEIIINSNGGNLEAMLQIITAIENCEAKTIAMLHTAKREAVNIFMACDEQVINDYSNIMIHNIGNCFRNNEEVYNKNKSFFEYSAKLSDTVTNKYQNKLLTKDELKNLELGYVEVYLLANDIKERLKAVQKPATK
jgi:ATP-dependent protease ClpP protease subunit